MKFLNFLKIVVGIPFFAVVSVLTTLFCFVLNSFFTSSQNPEKEQQKQDLNQRKERYKTNLNPIAINNYDDYLSWEDEEQLTPINQKQRQKKKALAKRRKRKKLAKKNRQQNRK